MKDGKKGDGVRKKQPGYRGQVSKASKGIETGMKKRVWKDACAPLRIPLRAFFRWTDHLLQNRIFLVF